MTISISPKDKDIKSVYFFRFVSAYVFSILIALCLSAAPTLVNAEQTDRDKPIVAESDKLSMDNSKKVSIFEGNVVITQGTMRITADRVVMTQDKDGLHHASGTGHPTTFHQKRDGKIQRIELFEQAELLRGRDEVKGEYISYDTVTEFFKVNGNAAREASGAGRVHAVIQPAQNASSTSAPSGKPASGSDKR